MYPDIAEEAYAEEVHARLTKEELENLDQVEVGLSTVNLGCTLLIIAKIYF